MARYQLTYILATGEKMVVPATEEELEAIREYARTPAGELPLLFELHAGNLFALINASTILRVHIEDTQAVTIATPEGLARAAALTRQPR